MPQPLRIGIVGLGNNTRLRHVPGLLAQADVEIEAVCNRSHDSTSRAANEFNIPKTFADWRELVADESLHAVMIGTWPYLHCPITLAALERGKHVLTEARMAADLAEAREMLASARAHPQLVAQIVPSPFGLRAGQVVHEMLHGNELGEIREYVVRGANADFADAEQPLHWRQERPFSGINMLALGILHETLCRWLPDPVRVCASAHTFSARASRPDSVHILTELANGARGIYFLSGVARHAGSFGLELYGTQGTLKYDFGNDSLWFGGARDMQLSEVDIPPDREGHWQVEQDFVEAIRGGPRPQLTDFASGLRYMTFTDAVERSSQIRSWVELCAADYT